MHSIRCANCNFLNFATEPACKRCRQPMGTAVPEAAASGYSTSNLQAVNTNPAAYQYSQPPQQVQFPSYYAPPPPNFYDEYGRVHPAPPAPAGYGANPVPPVCVKCGGSHDLSMQNFKKDYTPPIAYIGIFGGILPLLILVLVLRKRHKMNALFCTECWSRFKNHSVYSALLSFSCLGVLIGGIIAAIIAETAAVGLFAFLLAVGIAIFTKYFENKVSPKYVKMNRNRIFIKIPNYGEVDFTATTA
jgi:hypothetical protein